jgi:hypothetical protein
MNKVRFEQTKSKRSLDKKETIGWLRKEWRFKIRKQTELLEGKQGLDQKGIEMDREGMGIVDRWRGRVRIVIR